MNKINSILLALFSLVFLVSCQDKDEDPTPTHISFPNGGLATSTKEGLVADYLILDKFDKKAYAKVDSIVLSGELSSADGTTSSIVELVNLTDNVVINSGLLKASNAHINAYVVINSKNIYQELPSKEIKLGIRLRSEKEDAAVAGRKFQMHLYQR